MTWFKHRSNELDTNSLKYGVSLVTYDDPSGMVSEQFKTIRTNIQFSSVGEKLHSIMFTSSAPSEGKSTVSNNVAVTYADQGTSVILIDADLRRPTVHRTFDVSNRVGLSSYLAGNATVDEIIQPTNLEGLSVISSGPVPPNPSELLTGSLMEKLLDELSTRTDLLIVDAPPVNTVTDAQILGAQVDGTILVVPQGIALKAGVRHAKQALEMVHANILGAVMNRVTAQKSGGYYGGYYGGNYGGNYGGYYGTDEKK